jgi:hypothetical protein
MKASGENIMMESRSTILDIVKHWLSFSLGHLRTIVKRKISMAVFQVGRFLPLSRGPSMF